MLDLDKDSTFAQSSQQFIAHVRQVDGAIQPLYDHLTGTAQIAKKLATKIGLPLSGELIGLVHDLGKYSEAFQTYIRNSVVYDNYKDLGLDADEEAEILTKGKPKRGSVDHSTAGGQFLFSYIQKLQSNNSHLQPEQWYLLGQILSICIFSHHSGLINIIDKSGNRVFQKRLQKENKSSHVLECISSMELDIKTTTLSLITNIFKSEVPRLVQTYDDKYLDSKKIAEFNLGFYTRLLFSCLIDADRSNSIAFENPSQRHLLDYQRPDWQLAIDKVEDLYQSFASQSKGKPISPINKQRNRIAKTCYDAGKGEQGIYTLTVPTGGGKTLASLRFAVQHAKRHNLDRIVYIIPFTSIIEQNAQEVRDILEEKLPNGSYVGDWVLEQHSNLEPDVQTWQSKLIMDNWNAPVVFTTMVQFLESCFGGGTKGVRRLHQLSRAVLIFDEIQTLPINCYYLFCNAINFLTQYANTTAVLCTATQPVLDKLPQSHKGSLNLKENYEITGNKSNLHEMFNALERVDIYDKTTASGKNLAEMSEFIGQKFLISKSTLVIVNTKIWAKNLYLTLKNKDELSEAKIYHLSTAQCAKHRKTLLNEIRQRLDSKLPTLVISTQLIEAGVDISFSTVIRFLAGLDSIAQAAGRCNRHGEMVDQSNTPIKGNVYIVNPDKESLGSLQTIKVGKERTQLILNQLKNNPTKKSLLHPDYMTQYFSYFTQHEDIMRFMSYPTDESGKPTKDGRSSYSILNWLSDNESNPSALNRVRDTKALSPLLSHSFMEAGQAFKAIDAPTQSIIVPYAGGKELITDLLNKSFVDADFYKILKKTQQYTVNVFSKDWEAIRQVRKEILDTGIYVLPLESYYDEEFGLNTEGNSTSECSIL
ncbi:CRISPR-associated helicase/endonuclease Cas3 [Psychrobacter lutiphocae]|uniref:CRISPR-associated helicase/endonuclease Cas3 n=1 Tax=Psychrobacter lutiphocae TaxID=540500 RepID=UPI00037F422C|nr:CRISPR-associated helicase/endonuclease Cas3 [Psychrobacter lutiphocae]